MGTHQHTHNHYHNDGLGSEVQALFVKLTDLINEGFNQMAVDFTKITADITAQTTVLQGVAVGVQGLQASNAAQAQQIVDLKAALAAAQVTDPAVQAAADALDKSIQDNTALVSGLIPAATANTPDAPPAPAA